MHSQSHTPNAVNNNNKSDDTPLPNQQQYNYSSIRQSSNQNIAHKNSTNNTTTTNNNSTHKNTTSVQTNTQNTNTSHNQPISSISQNSPSHIAYSRTYNSPSLASSTLKNPNSPKQEHYSSGFNSQDIVNGLTQPTGYSSIDISRITHSPLLSGNELPTLPPLNVSLPMQQKQKTNARELWLNEDEKMPRTSSNSSVMSGQQDPSVLIQYQAILNSRNDRKLIPPYQQQEQHQQHQQPHQHQQQQQEVYGEVGPYGCGVTGCLASFSASNGLFYHMKSTHPNMEDMYKPYRCAIPTCPKRYKNINGLQYHLREAKGSSGHGINQAEEGHPPSNVKPYKCQIPGCKKAYRTMNGLRYHQTHGQSHQPHNIQPSQPPLPIQPQHAIIQPSQPPLQPQQMQSTPQFRMQREKWLLYNNI
ncbi:hypothetical protein BDB01DRAFT_809646 [Pilobolus umbonatus]|nr:hypothetical protein BDB01DRAFT_809646 [Pilobolus umbonatus]